MNSRIFFACVAIAWSSSHALTFPVPEKPGPNRDLPPFTREKNGIFDTPWGAANFQWPEKMFWENSEELPEKLSDMVASADGIEGEGKVPLLSAVAWGFELTAALGGEPTLGFQDMSETPGWKQWGEWVSARKDKYLAKNWEDKDLHPHAGYISFLMPLDSADWPEGIRNATYGDWAGIKLGTLANKVNARGIFAADFIVGLYGTYYDYNQRNIDDFSRWSGIEIPEGTVAERVKAMSGTTWPRWHDFEADRFARFYARVAETIRKGGREPLVGGQILPYAPVGRLLGNDFRIYLQHLPARNWYFQVELQSDVDRPVPPYWTASTNLGGHTGRVPDFPFGAHMDADQNEFWTSVESNNMQDSAWGWKYLKHAWLSVGWTHVAATGGGVQRAACAFQRGYWDQGDIDSTIVGLVRSIIPRHPFGPAFYYSTDLERKSEQNSNPDFTWWFDQNTTRLRRAGAASAYFVSDTALDRMDSADYPSGWYVFQDNEGVASLSSQERARLEKIAPIYDYAKPRTQGPLVFETDSTGGFAFIDQLGRVVVVVSNESVSDIRAAVLSFSAVENGDYKVQELLARRDTTLSVAGNSARFAIPLAARETRVFAIDGLRQLGRGHLVQSTTPRPQVVNGNRNMPRRDALGRQRADPAKFLWTAPAP